MKIKSLVVLIVILLLCVVIFFIFNKNNNIDLDRTVVEEDAFDCDSLNYSRISFFNTTDDRASLNVPESWEGNYRLKEEGNKAIFYYLLADGSASKMFSISKKNERGNDDEVICEKDDLKFILDIYDLKSEQYYNKIVGGLDCALNSIKCY